MKKILPILAIIVAGLALNSCEKDEGKLPYISFKTGIGYTSANANVPQGTDVLVGITAAKAEDEDVLKTFDVARVLDGGASTSIYTESLTGASGDNYAKDMIITTRATAGTEKYTFSVVNRDGLVNSVTLTLTTP
ncbi:MAG: hypothetical protein ABI741_16360 [Ferruginibacter sp.]